jgi:PPOX class probable F420-dependent enzyme
VLVAGAVGLVAADRRAVRGRETAETPDGVAAPHPFAPLRGQRYASLTTYRKSGEAVPTPLWFVLYGGRLHVTTPPNSGKMKRIRNDARVTLVASDFRGKPKRGATSIEGVGRDVSGADTAEVEAALRRKYWFGMRVIDLFGREENIGKVTLEVRPDGGPAGG